MLCFAHDMSFFVLAFDNDESAQSKKNREVSLELDLRYRINCTA